MHAHRMRPMMKAPVGYTDVRMEMLNPHTAPDVKETFDFSAPKGSDAVAHTGENIWPCEGPALAAAPSGRAVSVQAGFRSTCEAYLGASHALANDLLSCVMAGLGQAPVMLAPLLEDPLVVGRLVRYPPQLRAGALEMGAGSHIDYGLITLVYEDSPGLQVFAQDQWWRVPHIDGAIVVSPGYALEKLTNGEVPATKHRVVNENAVDRHTAVLFLDPSASATLAPLPAFVSVERPARYEACVAGKKGVRFGDPRHLRRAAFGA